MLAPAAVALVLAGCDRDGGSGDSESFCAGVADRLDELRAVPATPDDVEAYLDVWRDLGDDAPLAIEADWDTMVAAFEATWTGEDDEEILATVFASERSAVNIAAWLDETCGIDFGPVSTIVPQAIPDSTVSATSVPPG